MKILLTGCHGQLGQALQSSLSDHQLLCTASDDLDITDTKAVENYLNQHRPALVINAAAYTRVDDAESDTEMAYLVNETGALNLAQASKTINATILHVSTDYIFDGSGERPWLESDTPNPLSVYGKSKLAGEGAVQNANPKHFIVRTAWLYHHSGQNFLHTMHKLLKQHAEVRVVDDQRGSPTNADDLADAIALLIETQDYGIHHLANSGSASWYELTCEFYRLLGVETKVTPVTTDAFPRPAPRPANSVLGTERESAIRLPTWQQGLKRLVADLPADW